MNLSHNVSHRMYRERAHNVTCEIITAKELAKRWHVSVRWIMDRTRDADDPLPHFKRGKVKLFEWWDCPDSKLEQWWKKHMVAAKPASSGSTNRLSPVSR